MFFKHLVWDAQQEAHNKSLIGRTLDVLVEGEGREAGQLFGRSPYLTGTHFDGSTDLLSLIHISEPTRPY